MGRDGDRAQSRAARRAAIAAPDPASARAAVRCAIARTAQVQPTATAKGRRCPLCCRSLPASSPERAWQPRRPSLGEDTNTRVRLPALLAQAGDVFCIARDGRTFAAPNERNQAHEAAMAVAFGHPATRRCARSRCTPLRSWAWPTAWVRWRPVGSPVSLSTAIRWKQRHVWSACSSKGERSLRPAASRLSRLTEKYKQCYRHIAPR